MIQKPFRGMQINKTHPLARGLVGCWIFNERTGETVFDLSGNGNNGTIIGADWVADGLDFVSVNNDNYIDIPHNDLISNWTIIAKTHNNLQAPGSATGAMILGCGGDASASDFIYCTDNLRTKFSNSSGASVLWVTDVDFYNKYRTHAFVADASGIEYFLEDNTQGRQSIDPTLKFYEIGRGYTNLPFNYSGIIKYIYLYNYTLSSSTIAALNADPYQMFRGAINPAMLYYETLAAAVGTFGGKFGSRKFNEPIPTYIMYNAATTFALNSQVTPTNTATINAALLLTHESGVSDAGTMLTNQSLGIAATLALSQSATLNTLQLATLAQLMGITQETERTAEVSLTLNNIQSIIAAASKTANGTLTLASIAALIQAGGQDVTETLTLARTHGITAASIITIEGQTALLSTLGMTQSTIESGQADTTLSGTLNLLTVAEANVLVALSLTNGLALTQATGQDVLAGLTLAIQTGTAYTGLINIEAVTTLSAIQSLAPVATANANGALTLDQIVSISALGGSLVEAGITLNEIRGITIDGDQLVITVITPDSRTVKIYIENRTIKIYQ